MERGMSYYNRDQFGRRTIFVPQYLTTLDEKDLSELAQCVNAEQLRRARERVKKETDRLRAETKARRKAQRLQQPQTASPQSLHNLIYYTSPASLIEKELAAGADINATDCDRRTVLWRAAEHSKNELIALLPARGPRCCLLRAMRCCGALWLPGLSTQCSPTQGSLNGPD